MILIGTDIETTGLEWAEGHRIVEIALLIYQDEQLAGKFVQRINPQRPIDPKAQAVHGISFEDVSACPTWDAIAPKVSRILGTGQLIVAHNGDGFDRPFIEHELRRVGQPVASTPWQDTCKDARWATFFGKSPNLGELCFATGIEYDPSKAHGADYDVSVMMQAFFAARRQGFFAAANDIPSMRAAA
jgi:DNA polymerase-3 subunit epsilon